MDRQRVERCLEQVAAYRASGQKAKAWAAANGVALGTLGSWCAHAGRWQAKLEGVGAGRTPAPRPSGFVAARVAPSAASTSVRVELSTGSARLELRWPLAHTRELAALLRELGQ
jgi:hypothetical protein